MQFSGVLQYPRVMQLGRGGFVVPKYDMVGLGCMMQVLSVKAF